MNPAQAAASILAYLRWLRRGPDVPAEKPPPVRPGGKMRRIYKDKARREYENKGIGGYYG